MLYCPSMMCSNFNNLQNEVKSLDNAGADIFHIDIMDGNFVPNFGMGIQDIQTIRKNTNKLIDAHLMIINPGNYIKLFANLGVDIIYVHPEADTQITRTLDTIKELNIKSGIAINPGTPVSQIEELLPLVDYIMIMTVNPGFSGQKYLKFVENKIKKIVDLKNYYNYKIIIDGAVSEEVIEQLTKYEIDGFVLGTSTLFNKEETYSKILSRLTNLEVE